MATYALQFGAYVFPQSFSYTEIQTQYNHSEAKLVRAAGSNVVSKYLQGRTLSVSGVLFYNDILRASKIPLRTQLDALRAALASGPQNLYTAADRYLRNVYCVEFPESYGANEPERIAAVKCQFYSKDAYWYDVTVNTQNSNPIAASPNTAHITAGGTVNALPQFILTIGTTGTIQIKITCIESGYICTIAGAFNSGDIITIDALSESVSVNGSTDILSDFDGIFPQLQPGTNSVKTEYSGAGTVTNLAVHWQNRYI